MQAQGYPRCISDGDENGGGKIDFYGDDYVKACDGASAIVVVTEWDQFTEYDYQKLAKIMMPHKTVYDLRCYLPKHLMLDNFDKAFQLGIGWLK